MNRSKIYIIDTSAILSGKTLSFTNCEMATTESVSDELKPGGRDYQKFQFLKEKGLIVYSINKNSVEFIKKTAIKTGDEGRLSTADIDILALAYDFEKDNKNPVILTDDYSIQNVAEFLNLKFENLNQLKITKKFKWMGRCPGCGRIYKENLKFCSICGTEIKKIVISKEKIK